MFQFGRQEQPFFDEFQWHYLKLLTSDISVPQQAVAKTAGSKASSRRKPGSSSATQFWTPAFVVRYFHFQLALGKQAM